MDQAWKNVKMRERFWEYLNECITGVGEGERIVVLGDRNAKVGDRNKMKWLESLECQG